MKAADPYEEHDEHVGKTRGKHDRNTREITQPTRIDHTCTRSMNTKGEIQDPKSTTDDTNGNRFFYVRS